MLSIENQPADPSSSNCLLNTSTNCSDERASPNPTKLPSLPEVPVVDLPNPPLHHHHHTPLSNFSIRDYVFKARSKDIKKNWPFSHKNLQLCLKHGVKDVLPPFQPLDIVRNQSFRRSRGGTSSLEKQNISTESNFAKEPSGPDDHAIPDSFDDAQLNNKLAESFADISSCRSAEDHDFPSPTTSEIDSVPDNRQQPIRSPLQTRTSDKASVEVEVPATHKTESSSRPLAKKCRLIVKFGGNSDRSSTEDIASNCTTISETMASKVCPVCKTFSSSSNTTLNAHIDQCLSVESTPKWTGDSKLTRYRIKPRKTRLMVDIYATAQYCTLEELDRRNGTNWATISSLPSQETEKNDTPNEGKKQRMSTFHPEDASDVGPVYIDANGTKVRILSQISDQSPASKVREDVGARREDIGARKSLKGGKACKYIPKEKKKPLVQKHQKHLKLASQSENFFSHKPGGSQISGGLEVNNEQGNSFQNEHQMLKQIDRGECGTFRPWVCSKRRGFPKKITSQGGHQPVRCKWHLPQDLLVENDQSILGDRLSESSHVRKSIILSDSQKSSPRNSERMEKPYHKDLDNEIREHSPGKRTVGNHLVGGRISDKVDKLCLPMKGNANQLSKYGTSIRDSHMLRPPNSSRNNISSLKKKTVYTHDDASNNYVSSTASTKSSRSSRSVVAKAIRFSSFRKTVLSVSSQSSETESRPSKVKKWSILGHSPVHFRTERDEEAVPRNSKVDKQYSLMQDHTEDILEREEIADEVSLGDARQGGGLSHSSERDEAFRSSKAAPRCCHGDLINIDYLVTAGDDFRHKIDCQEPAGTQSPIHEHVVAEPSSNALNARSATSLSKPVHAQFYERVPSNVQSNCLRPIEDYRGLLSPSEIPAGPNEPGFVLDQEMFSTDKADNNTMGQNTDMGVELDSDAGPGDSFPEVDPIPIPGPPGSFLPSPRDMGSEDFQGNSSLTTSRVHSSTDQHEMVDGDSSDSPLSAASTISNSTAARSDFNCVAPSSFSGPYAVQDKIGSGLSSIAIEPPAQNAGAVPQAATAGVEKTTFDGEYIKLDRISIEKGSFGLRNGQPCCCQRKERFSQGFTLNHQESQLLRRRKMTSISVPPLGKQLGFNSNPRPINLDVRSEPVPTSNYPTSGSEKMVLPVIKHLEDAVPLKDSPDSGARLLAHAGFDSASPSASNPTLRLMGKNLIVVNKDDDPPIPLGQVQPCTPNSHQASQFSTISALSPGDIQNQDSRSLHHMVPRGSVIFGRDPYGTVSRCVDVQLSNSFGSCTDLKLPRAPAQLPAGMFHTQHKDGRFAASMESLECKDDYNLSSQQNRPKRRLNVFPTYAMQRATETPDRQCKHGDSSALPVKEIIVIDDAPESQTAVIGSELTRCNEGQRERQVVSAGISTPTVPMFNPSNVHPFACYQSQDHPSLGGSPVVHNGSFHPNATRLVNTGPVAWGCTSEGPAMLWRSTFMPTASQSGHLRSSALYYSPSFS